MSDTVSRFSNRVASYVRGRPHYPLALLACLTAQYGLGPVSAVADVGAGTGLLARLLLTAGCKVHAVEPNERMRVAADAMLGGHPGYRSHAGSAEATTLPERSVDFVTAGQAFHWFNPDAARQEFRRILRPHGRVALVWNVRIETGTPFLEGYQALLERHGIDYTQVDHRHVIDAAVLERFYGSAGYATHTFANHQSLTLQGVIDRLASTSYMPAAGHPGYPAMLDDVHALFTATAHNGRVRLEYRTDLFIGRV